MGCLKLYNNFTDLKVSHVSNCVRLKKSKKNLRRDYLFGFNGQEKDNEIKGVGNSLNYKARIDDVRLGRFLSVDPLASGYPWYTPYQFAGNTPIQAIDLDGQEPYYPLAKSPNEFHDSWLNKSDPKIILYRTAIVLHTIPVFLQFEKKSQQTKYGLEHLAMIIDFYKINIIAKSSLNPNNTDETNKGTRLTKGYCYYDCITSMIEGQKILHRDEKIKSEGDATKFISNNLANKTNGPVITANAQYASSQDRADTDEDRLVSGFDVDFAEEMIKACSGEIGVHFFAASLGGADHAQLFAVRISPGASPKFYKMDQLSVLEEGTKDDLTNRVKVFYQSNMSKTKHKLAPKLVIKKVK